MQLMSRQTIIDIKIISVHHMIDCPSAGVDINVIIVMFVMFVVMCLYRGDKIQKYAGKQHKNVYLILLLVLQINRVIIATNAINFFHG